MILLLKRQNDKGEFEACINDVVEYAKVKFIIIKLIRTFDLVPLPNVILI